MGVCGVAWSALSRSIPHRAFVPCSRADAYSLRKPGIINNMINLPPLLNSSLHHPLTKPFIHDIAREINGLPTCILDLLCNSSAPCLVQVRDDDARSVRCEEEGRRAAYALAAAGDDCDLAGEERAREGGGARGEVGRLDVSCELREAVVGAGHLGGSDREEAMCDGG